MFQDGKHELDARLLVVVGRGVLESVQVRLGTRHVALLRLAARNAQFGGQAEAVMGLRLVGRIRGEDLGRLGVFLEPLEREGAAEHGDVAERVVRGGVLGEDLVRVQRVLVTAGVEMALRETQFQRGADLRRTVFGHGRRQLVGRVGTREGLAGGGVAAPQITAHAVESRHAQDDDEQHHER